MAQNYRPGEIVPQSGVYKITHDPVHADMPHDRHQGPNRAEVKKRVTRYVVVCRSPTEQ
jgi:hypothetical protein